MAKPVSAEARYPCAGCAAYDASVRDERKRCNHRLSLVWSHASIGACPIVALGMHATKLMEQGGAAGVLADTIARVAQREAKRLAVTRSTEFWRKIDDGYTAHGQSPLDITKGEP